MAGRYETGTMSEDGRRQTACRIPENRGGGDAAAVGRGPAGTRTAAAGSPGRDRIRVAFVYRPSWGYYNESGPVRNRYLFFFRALQRNRGLQVGYFPAEQRFDTEKLRGRYDIILCTNSDKSTPHLENVKRTGIPVVAHTHDPHHAKRWDLIGFHEKWGIDCCFNFMPSSYFYRHFPRDIRYRTITYGVEPDLFPDGPVFGDRIKDRILLTGALGERRRAVLAACGILSPARNLEWHLYRLRRRCRGLPYVDYSGTVPGTGAYANGGQPDFASHLSRYRAAIAATRYYPTIKYYESTAAGCLTFMEVTGENDCGYLGFRDGETAVFIDFENYRSRFEEYLADPDDPRWGRIAARGRRHTMENLTNDGAAESLACLMRELV